MHIVMKHELRIIYKLYKWRARKVTIEKLL